MIFNLKHILFSLFVGLLFRPVFSQFSELNFNLSSKKINSSVFDSKGLFWIATDEGLDMFDGNKIHSFQSILSENNSLLNSEVKKIIEVDNNLLFIGKDGLSLFNREFFNYDRIKIPSPVSLVNDKENKFIYVSTSSSGIYKMDYNFNVLENFKTDPLNPFSLSSNSFSESNRQNDFKILNSNNGDLVIGINTTINVFNLKTSNFQRFTSNSNIGDELINSIYVLNPGNVLIARSQGLEIFDLATAEFKQINAFNNQMVYDLISFKNQSESVILDEFGLTENSNSANGYISFVLSNKGLFKIELDQNQTVKSVGIIMTNNQLLDNISISENYFYVWGDNKNTVIKLNRRGKIIKKIDSEYPINDICIDKSEDIIASTINGVYVDKSQNSFIKDENILGDQSFNDKRLNFYSRESFDESIIVDYEKISISSGQNTRNIFLKSFLDFETISFINNSNSYGNFFHYISNNNSLAVIGLNHLFIIDLNNYKTSKFDLPSKINFDKIDSAGDELFLSFKDGIFTFNLIKKQFEEYRFDDLFNKNFPRGFADIEMVEDQLWVSNLETGLHVFNGSISSEPILFSTDSLNKKRIASLSVSKIKYDKDKRKALISTNGDGLFIYNVKDSIFNQLGRNNGLLSNNIIDAEQGNEYIWVLTPKGINYFNDINSFKYEIDDSNGLDILLFNDNALRIIEEKVEENVDDGFSYGFENDQQFREKIEIVGLKKVLSFYPSDILIDVEPYTISPLNIKVFRNTTDFEIVNLVDGKIEIGSDVDFIEIETYTNNKFKRDQVEYVYSYNADTDDFISNGNENIIRLQSIPNYKSEIKIKSINKSGIESSNVLSVVISKTPPWYQRIETIVAYILFALVGIYFYSKWREQSTTKKMEEERRDKELKEARELQNSLLPKILPYRKEYDISVYLKSATEIGGDYYDFFENDKKELYAICGDATGHGVVSGIMVSVTKAGLSGINMADPSSILNKLNSIVKRVNFGRLRMSLSVAKINNGSLELSSAAMPPTYYYNAKRNNVEEILVPNLPLGGISGEKFDGVKKDFNKGDVLVMISDGLPELPNREDIMLDYPMVFDCIEQNCSQSAEVIKDALVDLSDKWADGLMNPDDITIVVIKKAS